ncbi:MAG: TldD/PmbA family protein [Thermoplasmata archaeon]|nr:TldD/PmbA family protein [Thermoplasmata archaeon]
MEEKALKEAARLGASYAEIRVEERWGDALEVKDGELEKAVHGRERGGSVRVLADGRWGFASTNRLENGLVGAVETAIKLARSSASAPGDTVEVDERNPAVGKIIWKVEKSPHDTSVEEKHRLLVEINRAVMEKEHIQSVTTSYTDGTRSVRILSSNGAEAYSEETRTVVQGVLVARDGSDILGYRFRIGGTRGFEIFDKEDPVEKGIEAAEAVVRILGAPPCPAGKFPVITDPDLAGVFVHEALGHAVEGDTIAAGGSVLSGKLGERLAPENVSVYDDPTHKGAFGSYPFDQEATPTRKKTIIERGVLTEYLLDRESSLRLGLEPNGSARAEDYSSAPQSRMSNTYIGQGDMSFEDMVSGIKLGIYAKGTRGGQVDPAKGTFQFGAQEAFLIEKGEVTKTLRDMSLSGNILDTLKSIDAVGNDLRLGDPGFCGKGGQLVPVGDGGPHIRIHMATVGGRG